LRKGLKQKEVTKVMTGGPDGDLGSNEILMGDEIIVGISDGSGVIFDPHGLDKNELNFLAKHRKPVEHFNGPFSSEGFKVKVTDRNIVLKNGEEVLSGLI